MVKLSCEKSGLPPNAAMNGVIRSFTSAVTTAPNAAPITTAIARSTTLPRSRNERKPFIRSHLVQRDVAERLALPDAPVLDTLLQRGPRGKRRVTRRRALLRVDRSAVRFAANDAER